ncbi:MAG: TonB family protein [Desulfobacterales bacterium]|nr:TonB family protein [Desulfobacterales bacterium]
MSIAADAMAGDRRFACALIVSAMVHAVTFHVLGDLQPRAMPDEVSCRWKCACCAAAGRNRFASRSASEFKRSKFSRSHCRAPVVSKAQPADVPRPRPERVLRARAGDSITASAACCCACRRDREPAAPARPVMPMVAEAPPEPPSRTSEPAPDRSAPGRVSAATSRVPSMRPRATSHRARARLAGTVKLRFRFLPGGNLDHVGVVLSSGIPLLDEHAVRMARAAELPRLPGALSAAAFELDVPIHFRLRS